MLLQHPSCRSLRACRGVWWQLHLYDLRCQAVSCLRKKYALMIHYCHSPVQMPTESRTLSFQLGVSSVYPFWTEGSSPFNQSLHILLHHVEPFRYLAAVKVVQGSKVHLSVWSLPQPPDPEHSRAITSLSLPVPAVAPCSQMNSLGWSLRVVLRISFKRTMGAFDPESRESRLLYDCPPTWRWITLNICLEFACPRLPRSWPLMHSVYPSYLYSCHFVEGVATSVLGSSRQLLWWRVSVEIWSIFPPSVIPLQAICVLIVTEPRTAFGTVGSQLERYCFVMIGMLMMLW